MGMVLDLVVHAVPPVAPNRGGVLLAVVEPCEVRTGTHVRCRLLLPPPVLLLLNVLLPAAEASKNDAALLFPTGLPPPRGSTRR